MNRLTISNNTLHFIAMMLYMMMTVALLAVLVLLVVVMMRLMLEWKWNSKIQILILEYCQLAMFALLFRSW